jgi:hypothetical protein
VLSALAGRRWQVELGAAIPRGCRSFFRCRMADGRVGALLIEAIEPGTPLVVASICPDSQGTGRGSRMEALVELAAQGPSG